MQSRSNSGGQLFLGSQYQHRQYAAGTGDRQSAGVRNREMNHGSYRARPRQTGDNRGSYAGMTATNERTRLSISEQEITHRKICKIQRLIQKNHRLVRSSIVKKAS